MMSQNLSSAIMRLPIMPLREVVMLPRSFMPLFVGRKATIHAINRSIKHHDSLLVMVAQRDSSAVELASRREIFHVGTVSRILRTLPLPDDNWKMLFEGLYRVRLVPAGANPKRYEALKTTSLASLYPFEETLSATNEQENLIDAVEKAWAVYARKIKRYQSFVQDTIGLAKSGAMSAPGILADVVAQFLKVPYLEKQKILETSDGVQRLQLVYTLLQGEIAAIMGDNTTK